MVHVHLTITTKYKNLHFLVNSDTRVMIKYIKVVTYVSLIHECEVRSVCNQPHCQLQHCQALSHLGGT